MNSLILHISQFNNSVGDLNFNTKKIIEEIEVATKSGADLSIFCEMCLTGYPALDLWQKECFLDEVDKKIEEIKTATKNLKASALIAAPLKTLNKAKKQILYNAVFLIENGEITKIIRKKTLPNYGVFDEKRYFESDSILSYIDFKGSRISVLICEDLWDVKNLYLLQEQEFDFVISINASPYSVNKKSQRMNAAKQFVNALKKPLIYVNQVGAQDSLVFDGSSFALNADAEIILQLKSFEEQSAIIEIKNGSIVEFKDKDAAENIANTELSDIYSACVLSLRDYVYKNNFAKILLGMSGGIDSAIVATIATDAIGCENVSLYALPSRFNSESSMIDAKKCAENLCIDLEIISIEESFKAMLSSLQEYCSIDSKYQNANIARENLQSRIRGNILMAISNATGALLLSTGNKSELATGYATIYGDMCGAFNPIKDLYKTQIYKIAKWRNENFCKISSFRKQNIIPLSIINKEPTAELRENQKDSDSLPNYDILDKILFLLIEENKSIEFVIKCGFDKNLVKKIAKLFYSSEYKRAQSVIGAKISEMSFDKERRYPITNKFFQ